MTGEADDATRTARTVAARSIAAVDGARRALREQLRERLRALDERALDAERALRAARREREDAGVELYAKQEALAHARADWLARDARTRRARDARVDAERETIDAEDAAARAAVALREATARATREREALEGAALGAREDGDAAKVAESAVEVAKRVASLASEALDSAERERIERESRVVRLRECVERARAAAMEYAESASHERKEAAAIRADIEACDEAISNANLSVDLVCKKWRSVLQQIGVQDETLEQHRREAHELGESSRVVDAEREGAQEVIAAAQTTKSAHLEALGTLDKDVEIADSLIVSLRAAVQDKKSQCDAVHAEARNLDEIARAEEKRVHDINADIQRADQAYITHTRELHDLEEKALMNMVDKMTTNQLAQKLTQSTRDHKSRARAAANESIIMRHKIAQVKVELMRCVNDEAATKDHLLSVERNISTQRAGIDACESNIIRNVEEIERLTCKVNSVNTLLEKVLDVSPEHVGPLEAQISHLRKEIAANEQSVSRLRDSWLRSQNAILAYNERDRDLINRLDRLMHENDVLTKKRDRHSRNARRFDTECESISKTIERQRRKLGSIDEKVASTRQDARENALKALEEEDVRMREIDALSEVNSKLRAEIRSREEALHNASADSESLTVEISDFARKIELEQRAQLILDPTKGNSQVSSARKENAKLCAILHRLESQRSHIASKVEACVKRRELIVAKGDVIQAKINAKGEKARELEMIATAKRAQSDVKRRLSDARAAAEQLGPRVRALESEYEKTRTAHEKIATMTTELSERRDFLRVETATRLRDKYEHALLRTSSHQKVAQTFEKARETPLDAGDEGEQREKYRQIISNLRKKRDNMLASIRDEISSHPHLAVALRRAEAYLTVA